MNLEDLPIELLVCVAKYISVRDRLWLEKTSPYLSAVVARSWYQVCCLQLSQLRHLPNEDICRVVQKCGIYLKKLVAGEGVFVGTRLVDAACQNCRALVLMDFSGSQIDPTELVRLCAHVGNTVAVLNLDSTNHGELSAHAVEQVVQNLPVLRDLNLLGQSSLAVAGLFELTCTYLDRLVLGHGVHMFVLLNVLTVADRIWYLKELVAERCYADPSAFRHFCEDAIALRVLNISNARAQIDAVSIAFLRSLRELYAAYCSFQSPELFRLMSLNCASISTLVLHNSSIMDDSMIYIAKLSYLSYLDVSGSRSIHDWSLQLLGGNCLQLSTLLCCQCLNVRGTFLQHLVSRCPKLVEIGLFGCRAVASEVIVPLVDVLLEPDPSDPGPSVNPVASSHNCQQRRLKLYVGNTDVNFAWLFNDCRISSVFLNLVSAGCGDHSHYCYEDYEELQFM